MDSNSSSTGLVIGLAAIGLALIVSGVRLYRRRRAVSASGGSQDDMHVEACAGGGQPVPGEDSLDDGEAHMKMGSTDSQGKFLLQYFLLVFVLAVPFWLFGGGKLPLPINLPVSALATFVPVTAAAILSYRQSGFTGVKELLKKAWDFKKIKIKIWYLPTLLLMPLISFLSYTVMRWMGLPLPDPINIPLLIVPIFLVMFFIGDAGEELGWMGYAIDPLQNRWGAIRGSLILGVLWVTWHIIPWVQTGNPAAWILWQSLFSIAFRILSVWIYNNTGKSVFAAILFHVTSNISWSLFPNYGSHYNPFVTGLITWLTVAIVITGWGPKTLARYRHAGVRMMRHST